MVDSAKHEIKKFLKKERKKPLPAGVNYWGFDCKFGQSEETAIEVPLSALNQHIDETVKNGITTLYVEITTKAIESGQDSSPER